MADLAAANGTDGAGVPRVISERSAFPTTDIADGAGAGEAFQKDLLFLIGFVPIPEVA